SVWRRRSESSNALRMRLYPELRSILPFVQSRPTLVATITLPCQASSKKNDKRRVMIACQRVPHSVVCLESALCFHGVLPPSPGPIRLAIHRKARKPALQELRLRFVWFSGQALTQGVVNMRIDGEPVRVYSVAKTIVDCLKYRRKLAGAVLSKSLDEALCETKCTRERLLHFARICRVEKILRTAAKGYSHSCALPRRCQKGAFCHRFSWP